MMMITTRHALIRKIRAEMDRRRELKLVKQIIDGTNFIFVACRETLVGAKGEKGDKGDNGDNGNDGLQGQQGLKGDNGSPGIQGDAGLQGLKGDKGDVGAQGLQGLTGPMGEGVIYRDRGNPSLWDFQEADFNNDGFLHELDLSAIVSEEGANQLVHISVKLKASASNRWIYFTKLGQTKNISSFWHRTQVANQPIDLSGFVKMDENRKIQYATDGGNSWKRCRLIIRGWFEQK